MSTFALHGESTILQPWYMCGFLLQVLKLCGKLYTDYKAHHHLGLFIEDMAV